MKLTPTDKRESKRERRQRRARERADGTAQRDRHGRHIR
jgi:hypothetical protein